LLYYFVGYEDYTYPPGFYGHLPFNYPGNFRGNEGPVKVTQTDSAAGGGFAGQFISATKQVFPNIAAFYNNSLNNGYFPGVGVAPPEHTYYDGFRTTSYTAYVQTYSGSNLRSIAHVRVNKILLEGTRVTGVELVFINITTQHANSSTCVVSTNTVITSAGAFGTPKLLKLSGIGPRAELEANDIHVVVENEYVGTNLVDHFSIGIRAISYETTLPEIPDIYGQVFWNVADSPLLPPDFSINVPVINVGIDIAIFTATRVYPDSRGSVTLASSDPDDPPVVNPNYLSTLRDQLVTAVAINKTTQIINQLGLYILGDPCLSTDCSTPLNLLNAWVETGVSTPGYHYSGTSEIGNVVDPTTLKVYGTIGLYVLDASVFPLTPGENSQSTTYAVSEKGIRLIIADHPYWPSPW
jgi:choline dehydrogenase